MLQCGFRRLVPSIRPIHGLSVPAQPAEIIGPAVPVPETRTIQGPPTPPVDISPLVPYFQRQTEAIDALRTAAPFAAGALDAVRSALAPLGEFRSQVQDLVFATQSDLQQFYTALQSLRRPPWVRGVLIERERPALLKPEIDPFSTPHAFGGLLGSIEELERILTDPERIASYEALREELNRLESDLRAQPGIFAEEAVTNMRARVEEIRGPLATWDGLLEQYFTLLQIRLTESGQLVTAISKVLEGTAFPFVDHQFVPRQVVEDSVGNQRLSPPERKAAFIEDTRGVASLIPKMREGVQSQVDALAEGAAEAWKLRNEYREAVNKAAAEIGQRHMATKEKAERGGR